MVKIQSGGLFYELFHSNQTKICWWNFFSPDFGKKEPKFFQGRDTVSEIYSGIKRNSRISSLQKMTAPSIKDKFWSFCKLMFIDRYHYIFSCYRFPIWTKIKEDHHLGSERNLALWWRSKLVRIHQVSNLRSEWFQS